MTATAALKAQTQPEQALEVEVVERRDTPGAWGVEAINAIGDGEIYMAIFSGPQAKERAIEYADMKYGEYRLAQ